MVPIVLTVVMAMVYVPGVAAGLAVRVSAYEALGPS